MFIMLFTRNVGLSHLYKIHDMTQRDMENHFALYQCTNGSVLSATTKQVSREWENGSINQQQGMFSIDFFFSYLAIFTAGPFGLTNSIIYNRMNNFTKSTCY